MYLRYVPCLFLGVVILSQLDTAFGEVKGCVLVLTSYGTPYENGYCLGKQFASQIEEVFNGYEYYVNRTVPWSSSVNGISQFNTYKDTINLALDERFKEEIQGLADGSGRLFNEILLLNLEPEVRAFLGDSPITAYNDQNFQMYIGSSDFQFKTVDSNTFFVHQHDLDSIFHNKVFVFDSTYVRPVTGDEIESFVSVMIPGFLPGLMFATNRQSFTYTINPMFPKDYFRGSGFLGVPLNIYIRSLLNESANAVDNFLLLDALRASPVIGPSISIWETNSSSIDAYETYMNSTGLQQTGSYKNVQQDYYYHFNEYSHLSPPLLPEEKYIPLSTLYRTLFMGIWDNTHTALANKAAVMNIISNQDYPDYPIYKDPNDGDRTGTMFSVVIYTSGASNLLELYLRKPSTNKPVYKLNLSEYWSESDYVP